MMMTSELPTNSDYYETLFLPVENDIIYPPVAREIMWGHSLKSRLLEDLNAIRALDLP